MVAVPHLLTVVVLVVVDIEKFSTSHLHLWLGERLKDSLLQLFTPQDYVTLNG
jgi:hypothetical protein